MAMPARGQLRLSSTPRPRQREPNSGGCERRNEWDTVTWHIDVTEGRLVLTGAADGLPSATTASA